jgi:arginyl-tRNA synthetase
MQKDLLKPIFEAALNKIDDSLEVDIQFEIPNNPDHGDFSSNVAMQLAKPLRMAPRKIAEQIIENMEYDQQIIEKVDIAGPGFINVKFSDNYYTNALIDLYQLGDKIGRSDIGDGKKVNVEYVSANPTGLLHLGHGRNAAIGDTISNLFEWTGHEVTREYYFNNAGNQMNNLAKSIYARYMQLGKDENFAFPEDGYHGEYIKTIAKFVLEESGEKYIAGNDDDLATLRKIGEKWCFARIKETLHKMNIKQDVFYNENSLYDDGKIDALVEKLKQDELAYEKDGALWLALKKLGKDDDRVIIKSTGEPTYRLPDIAYHKEKFERGFDIIVDLFGADHIATVPDVMATVEALGYDLDKVKVLIHQFVTLSENGVQVKMSKRSGKSYTLDELVDEVGADVVRFFLIMRGISTHLEFDLGLAKEQSDKNPVFYLQYAHARICSLVDKAMGEGLKIDDSMKFDTLQAKEEIELIKSLLRFQEVVLVAATKCEPQILCDYLRELAQAFHVFYHECRIIGEDEKLAQARLKLTEICGKAMKNGLSILGVSAPERM